MQWSELGGTQARSTSLTMALRIRHSEDMMTESGWSVEQVLGAVRELPPEAQQEVLARLPSVLSPTPEELAWLRLAEPTFEFWDNPEDAAYDAL